MSTFRTITLTGAICLAAFLGYKYITYEPGYCSAQQRYLTDEELIMSALQIREAEIAHYGGMDAYEKYFINNLNRHPEEAGRDFDAKDPSCCKVYRGKSAVKNACAIDDYPLCVRLYFPPLKQGEWYKTKYSKYYERRGRMYFFDDCGKLRKDY
ncbi:MAG: hypothetical protein KJ558_00790 [Gammaproteobacteria bacterium]|nr:hypothetical protein [Gammaproteobacteria bacterium]MBU1653372.1 hypothetical protein [Gammaproteobacteria bacterium]MBU1960527.1 hypothetical protein [Gammaproteobacteria bacterium]